MVEGAAFFLLCHDDIALDPDVVHNLVEESFRSNAGVVSPKFVNWDDPSILLHVGMHCDKTGAVVDRIQDGEVDHGQHDAVRDVFVAPGGCILIRADLWRELEGFDAGILAMGEDLDLSWRSQVAGSRVVVAPDARVRHREAVASGAMPLEVAGVDTPGHPVTLQALQRRHELRTVLKCYTFFHLIRVLPQAALLAIGEVVVALCRARPAASPGRGRRLGVERPPPGSAPGAAPPARRPPPVPRRRGTTPPTAGERATQPVPLPLVTSRIRGSQRRGAPRRRGEVAAGCRAARLDRERRPFLQRGRRLRRAGRSRPPFGSRSVRAPGAHVVPRAPGANGHWPGWWLRSWSPSAPGSSSSAHSR